MRGGEPVVRWRSEPRQATINSSSPVSERFSIVVYRVCGSGDGGQAGVVRRAESADFLPVARRNPGERLDDRGVELRPGEFPELREGRLVRLSPAVAAVGS